MRVSRAKAEENRNHVIEVASRLFREHGFDGIGLKDLMQGAGLTQGAFYKQFTSKEDLAAQASQRALESAYERWSSAATREPDDALGAILRFYLSTDHRGEPGEGCPMVALGADAARQGDGVRQIFEAGVRQHLDMLIRCVGEADFDKARALSMAILSTMVGAVVIARSVKDDALSREFLAAASASIRTAVPAGRSV